MVRSAHEGFNSIKTMPRDKILIDPDKLTDPRMAPIVTIIAACISINVGAFFSVNASIIIRYKITICVKGITTEGSSR
jgi:hypothetical protein